MQWWLLHTSISMRKLGWLANLSKGRYLLLTPQYPTYGGAAGWGGGVSPRAGRCGYRCQLNKDDYWDPFSFFQLETD